MTVDDNGRTILVDLGQVLQLSVGGEGSDWVRPYFVGPRGATGQDRVLYMQQAAGYPPRGPASARLLAGNPGDVIVETHSAACGDRCDPAKIFRVTIYVNTVPRS